MGATLHVLLVEDSEFDSLTHRTRIRAAFPGSTVTVVERLSEALAFLDANRVEVVLTDLGLPDSSGLATVEAFALVAETVPVIVLSGAEPSEELRLRAIELGAQDFLLKGAAVPEVYRSCIGYAIKRKELDLEARRLARTDTLTGLLNRRAIIERIKTALDGATFPDDTVTVAFCDVDDFKAINDLYGHSVGDAILQEIATTISSKAPDAAVGRLGGDEFCLVCAGHSFREVVDAVSELNEAFSAPITVGRRSLTVSYRGGWGDPSTTTRSSNDRLVDLGAFDYPGAIGILRGAPQSLGIDSADVKDRYLIVEPSADPSTPDAVVLSAYISTTFGSSGYIRFAPDGTVRGMYPPS